MYQADPRVTHLPVSREQIVTVYASLNKPAIAVPGKAAQEVQAFIVGVRNPNGHFTLFVYLFLTQSREAVVYVDHDRLQLSPEIYAEAESDAQGFVESMGFMLDNMNFRSLAPAAQTELMQSMPCFTKEHKAAVSAVEAAAERPDTPQVRLARLFASF